MQRPLDINAEELILKDEINKMFAILRAESDNVPADSLDQVKRLFQIRSKIYEDLNQLQHKSLIILSAKELQKEYSKVTRWCWHPKQTSSIDEADLTGYIGNEVFINAEVTTSMEPKGSIDSRMGQTLNSLNRKKGRLFYYVQTQKMLTRALTKIKKNNWTINARLI